MSSAVLNFSPVISAALFIMIIALSLEKKVTDPVGDEGKEKHEFIVASKKVGGIDFHQSSIEDLKKVPALLAQIYRSVLIKGTDYEQIAGSSKPSLLKAGAELLAGWLKITPDSKIVKQEEDYDRIFFSYTVETKLYDQNGLYIGNGFGSCNSKEPGYAFRWVYERDIPPDLDKSKLLKRQDGRYRIDATVNEIFGQANAILKKAKKRAFVDAILTVTGASRIFTQDVGEDGEEERAVEAKVEASPMPPSASTEELTAEMLEGLPWKVYREGHRAAWIFADKAPAPLIKAIILSQGIVEIGGFSYKFSGPKEDPERFITRVPKEGQ